MLRPMVAGGTLPGPPVRGATLTGRRAAGGAVTALAAGFAGAATLAFGAAGLAGAAFGIGHLPDRLRIGVALVICLGMCVVDVASLKGGTVCKLTFRRQAVKSHIDERGPRVGAFLWGLDTGLAVTTIRVSAATWTLFTLSALQIAPWWSGLAYAAGFCLSLAVATLIPAWRAADASGHPQEPLWIQRALLHRRHLAQLACLLVLALTTAVLAARTFSGQG